MDGLLACALLLGTLAGAGGAVAAEPPFQRLARATVGSDQGVFVAAGDGTVLASVEAARPVHPASVTKVASTLALLRELGADYRFETAVLAGGTPAGDRIPGDLLIEAGRDPFFVYENAFLVLLALRDLGVRRCAGGVAVRGPLLFNWQPDPTGARLQEALAGRDGAAAWAALRAAGRNGEVESLRDVALEFGGRTDRRDGRAAAPLLVHRSAPLRRVAKELNGYSNNVFHLVSEQIGGPGAVERIARGAVPAGMRAEIVIDNAAGGGRHNRMSPRAAAALIDALRAELSRQGLRLVDVLPVAGVDRGTLEDRLREPAYRGAVVAKTGTYGSLGACALAGALRTRRHGEVTFAILNRGLSVPEARRRQDAFLRALMEEIGAEPWPYVAPRRPPFTEARIDVTGR
jgi:D-alanyl-D-alanine carboxypeptidase/D-alanyl-D-alanine-endopeptidase (penicillin-binding protein 4)